MSQLICSKCMEVTDSPDGTCPLCGRGPPHVYNFRNSDQYLKREVTRIQKERKELGLEELVGGLECVIINTEPVNQTAAIAELLQYTGLHFDRAFADSHFVTGVLKSEFLIFWEMYIERI